MSWCLTPGRHRKLTTGRHVNTAVCGPALGAKSIRATVMCFLWQQLRASWRWHTDCAVRSLLLKPDNTRFCFTLCTTSEARRQSAVQG